MGLSRGPDEPFSQMKELEASMGKPLSMSLEKAGQWKTPQKAGDKRISSLFSKARKKYILETECETARHNLSMD